MIITVNDLPKIREDNKNKSIVLALGAFDILHPGHIKYLEWAKQQGDVLVVTLKSDEQITSHKGPTRPVVLEEDRVTVVNALKPVDYALVGASGGLQEAAFLTAQTLQPDVIVLGPDWGHSVLLAWKAEFPNTSVLIASTSSNYSTTSIINKIQRTSI